MTTTHQPDAKPLKNKAGLAAVVAAVACAVACAAPLLLGAGLFAGLGALFTDSDFLAPVILVGTAAAAVFWWRRTHRAATEVAAGCSPTGGCGTGGC